MSFIISATFLLLKKLEPVGEVKPGEPPSKLIYKSRVVPHSATINERVFSIKLNDAITDEFLRGIGATGHEAVVIEHSSELANQDEAFDRFMSDIESLCDGLAFQMLTPIYIREVSLKEINEKGEYVGEGQLFPFPNGFQPEKFMQAISAGQVGEIHPFLNSWFLNLDKEMTACLRWYHKALIAPFEIDKFIFFFIVCEILSKRGQTRVKQLYRNKCGHEIPSCPTCGVTTEKEINGGTIRAFLEEQCGVDAEIAKQIWNYRQILHGSNEAFKPKNNLSRLILELQHAITSQLKTRLEIPEGNLPTINKDVPVIGNMGFTTIN